MGTNGKTRCGESYKTLDALFKHQEDHRALERAAASKRIEMIARLQNGN
jgi:hypothetical protein